MELEQELENHYIKDLEEKIRYLDSIIALLPGHVYWLDRNNILRGCNDLQAEAVNRSRHELVGKRIADFIPAEQAAVLDSINLRVMETGESFAGEEIADMANGPGIYLSKKSPII